MTPTPSRARLRPANGVPGLRGSMVALVTPFRAGEVDYATLGQLCERQVEGGSAAIVVCGSTGEGASLTLAEHGRVVAVAVEAVAPRMSVIAGCGAPSTDAAVALAVEAARNGAAAMLCAPPPYCRPTQDGIFAHIRGVAHAVGRPVLAYDIPARVQVAIADATVARLYKSGLIVGIKDAGGSLSRPARLRALCGGDLVQLSGDDATAAAHRAMGGDGCVSVTANVAPALCARMHAAWNRADLAEFGRVRDVLAPLHDALALESNPIAVKAALCMMGLCDGQLRLPLTMASSATLDLLATIVAEVTRAEDDVARSPRLTLVG